MSVSVIGRALSLFAVTNVDDLVVLALFFAQGARHRGATTRIVIGQYLGFAAILAVAIGGAFGATLLPKPAVAYLGLLPLALGLRAAWKVSSDRHRAATDKLAVDASQGGPRTLEVALVTFANGGDNIGVYIPVFAATGVGELTSYAAVFLVLVGVWVAAGRFFATRERVAVALGRWGHSLLPVVLIGIGLTILVQGGAFGL